MPTLIRELAARLKGTMQETEDWWSLMRDDNGSLYVEHTWSHTKLNGSGSDDGEEKIGIQEFLNGDHMWANKAQVELRKYIEEHGLT